MEKFLNIVCRVGGLAPSADRRRGDGTGAQAPRRRSRRRPRRDRARLGEPAPAPRDRPVLRAAGGRGGQPVRRATPTQELDAVRRLALELRRARRRDERWLRARRAARRRSRRRSSTPPSRPNGFAPTYPLDASIPEKIEAIATRVYGAAGVHFLQPAEESIARFTADGLDRLPVCMAKTHLSLSDDPTLLNAPRTSPSTSATSAPTPGPGGSSRSAARS